MPARLLSTLFRSVLSKKGRIKSIKRKYCEIVSLGILNCPLIIPYRLTKTCSDQQNNNQKYNYKCLLKVALLTLLCQNTTNWFPLNHKQVLVIFKQLFLTNHHFGLKQYHQRLSLHQQLLSPSGAKLVVPSRYNLFHHVLLMLHLM